MQVEEFPTFAQAFKRMAASLRRNFANAAEAEDVARTYFRILNGYELGDVLRAGKTLLTTAKRFPQPAEWLAALPRRQVSRDRRHMTASECAEYADAARQGFTGEPCGCRACVAAGVSDRALRYVPTMADDTHEERAFNPSRDIEQTVGHWAHGDELARWYAAQGTFLKLVKGRVYRAAVGV